MTSLRPSVLGQDRSETKKIGLKTCLFGLAVECTTARLSSTRTAHQLNRTGYESGAGCEIRSGAYAIGLISWAASEGSTVSSLICDRWFNLVTRKLATFMGSTDSLEC